METFIADNGLLVIVITSLAGALIHWWQKVRRGEATEVFMDYWFKETPGYSLGTFGALAGYWFTMWASGSIDTSNLPLLLSSAFTFGFAIDSMVAPKAKPEEKA